MEKKASLMRMCEITLNTFAIFLQKKRDAVLSSGVVELNLERQEDQYFVSWNFISSGRLSIFVQLYFC